MTQQVRDIMTSAPETVGPLASVRDVARLMRDENLGAVLVADADALRGLISDRDLVVRAIAEGRDPEQTTAADVCSDAVVTAVPNESLDEVVERMRKHSVRRIPVVDGGDVVGIVSLGDLAIERDEDSALADISAARPNR